jgi:hypothetical protein
MWRHCSKETKPRENFFSDMVAELFKAYPDFLFQRLHDLDVDLRVIPTPVRLINHLPEER